LAPKLKKNCKNAKQTTNATVESSWNLAAKIATIRGGIHETQQAVHEWRLTEKGGHEESLDLDPFTTEILDSEHGHVIA
jgi:hypothetical protein